MGQGRQGRDQNFLKCRESRVQKFALQMAEHVTKNITTTDQFETPCIMQSLDQGLDVSCHQLNNILTPYIKYRTCKTRLLIDLNASTFVKQLF